MVRAYSYRVATRDVSVRDFTMARPRIVGPCMSAVHVQRRARAFMSCYLSAVIKRYATSSDFHCPASSRIIHSFRFMALYDLHSSGLSRFFRDSS